MPRQKGRGPSVQQIFKARMEREGKLAKFLQRWKEIAEKKGIPKAPAIWDAMKEFGYIDPEDERSRHEAWLKLHPNAWDERRRREIEQQTLQQQAQEITKLRERYVENELQFEHALAKLPSEYAGILADDLLWIYTHPAMSRLARQKDNAKIILTAKDLEHRVKKSDGSEIVPNSGMVQMLQFYVNEPASLYRQVLDKMKKESASVTEEKIQNFDSPEDLEKIEQMIKHAANAGSEQ